MYMSKVIIIMGVSGCGKSTIASDLSEKTNIPYYDADAFHPPQNIAKMSKGNPLNDNDREPWLHILRDKLSLWSEDKGAILACSALKESYRKILSENVEVQWIYLHGTYDLIYGRLQARKNHFVNGDLLQSQFDTLEEPKEALRVSIANSPEKIIEIIQSNINMNLSFFGVIGLGVMGKSISLNIAEKEFSLSVYNRATAGEEKVVKDFLEANQNFGNIKGYTDLKEFVKSLARPRKILIMIKAGKVTDLVINDLTPFLEEGDIIIDGGNSHYKDTQRRTVELSKNKIHFVGSGVSGGEEGARRGPSIMPGGTQEAYQAIAPVLDAISAKDANGKPCSTHIGPDGAGHFIKMVHNGIEYAEMQLLAECFSLLSPSNSHEEISTIFSEWNKGELSSYLLEITANILKYKEGDQYTLDLILDRAGNKGTGSWSSKAAFDYGSTNTMMSASVFARYISSYKSQRVQLAKNVNRNKMSKPIDIGKLKAAYQFARIINHHQGFELMRSCSTVYNWKLDFSEISRIWTNGCIIRSTFMQSCVSHFMQGDSLLDNKVIINSLVDTETNLDDILQTAITNKVPTPCLSNARNYWISMTTAVLPANVIQAQRDYFGAHTYQRIDKPEEEFFHTKWY